MTMFGTNWHAGMTQASAKIDDTFGETLVIIPCVRAPNFGAVPSPADAITVTGVFRWRTVEAFGKDMMTREAGGLHVESRKPVAEFDRASLPWAIRAGDRIERVCDGTVYEVTAAMPDGVARITTRLVQCGRQDQ